MASKHRNIARSDAEYTRIFEKMRGFSATKNPTSSSSRFGMLENMYVDYRGSGEAVESIPGFRKLLSFDNMPINGIFNQHTDNGEDYLIIHAGIYVCRFKKNEMDTAKITNAIATMKDTKSSAFSFGDAMYIIDGESMLKINQNGTAIKVGDGGLTPYLPTLYRNGVPYEKRNLLTSKARESYVISNPAKFIYGTPYLSYTVTDSNKRLCSVIGERNIYGEVHIPSYVTIDGQEYSVTSIAGHAFADNENITALITNPGLKKIEAGAFSGCKNLASVILSCTVETIETMAFYGCVSLSQLHFNKFPIALGKDSFKGISSEEVKCSGIISDFQTAVAGSGLEEKTPRAVPMYEKITLGLRAHGQIWHIDRVLHNNVSLGYDYNEDPHIAIISFENEAACREQELIMENTLLDGTSQDYNDDDDFLATEGGFKVGGVNAIFGCRICEAFDGRIFLSGNPNLPGVVFYSEPDRRKSYQPLYFKSNNYFIDGIANNQVTAMLSTHGALAVFKEADDGAGTIIYHEPKTESGTREVKYQISYAQGSIPAYGGEKNFFDEALFLTERGVCALEKTEGSSFKEVKCRSELINALLLKEDLRNAQVTEWQGYFVVATGENMYLADSRDSYKTDGILQYEWYRLCGIGSYKNDTRVYRYSDEVIDGYQNSPHTDEIAEGEIYSELFGERTVYYLPKNGKKLLVYKTEEFTGGDFDPCYTVFSDGENLYFGTRGGDVCMFNSDKRGVPPKDLSQTEGFSIEEYKSVMGSKIHPVYYSFDRHAARYGVTTESDNCEIPYLTKNTVRDSLVVNFKAFEGSCVSVKVETDNEGCRSLGILPLSTFSFDSVDFSKLTSSLSDQLTIAIAEAERGWTEKRLSFLSDRFCSPFGVYSICYRYRIKGKIK